MRRALLLVALLSGCAQQAPRPADIHDPTALRYLNQHGARVEVQVPPQGWVDASLMIDAKAAEQARGTNQRMTQNAIASGGILGAALASAINTQVGEASLQREAARDAKQAAQPLAVLLSDHPYNGKLQQRYQQAAATAGLRPSSGAITASLHITPKVVLSPDRGSFLLASAIDLQDIAGMSLYRTRIEVQSLSLRRCGEQCIDDGGLDPQKIEALLGVCIDEAMRTLAMDLQRGPDGQREREKTIRYRLDGRRVVERGRVLEGSEGYLRYRNLDGALKVVPVAMVERDG